VKAYFLLALILAAGCMGAKAVSVNVSTGSGLTGLSLDGSSSRNTNTEENKMVDNVTAVKERIAVIETNKGTIKFKLYEKDAPITTSNFIGLANKKFYDGLTFHRIVPGFVVQGGDPKGDGTGGSRDTIPLEVSPKLKHTLGAVAMARAQDPNSASSQFYITLAPQPSLDGQYAVFGQVISGQNVVNQIKMGDRMTRVYIVEQ